MFGSSRSQYRQPQVSSTAQGCAVLVTSLGLQVAARLIGVLDASSSRPRLDTDKPSTTTHQMAEAVAGHQKSAAESKALKASAHFGNSEFAQSKKSVCSVFRTQNQQAFEISCHGSMATLLTDLGMVEAADGSIDAPEPANLATSNRGSMGSNARSTYGRPTYGGYNSRIQP